ncbi:MAG: hypothetical protein KTR24_09105 [Saprospiraceae bacterium]|nr:hypothetical protein [Saprospiraceae bacterium]
MKYLFSIVFMLCVQTIAEETYDPDSGQTTYTNRKTYRAWYKPNKKTGKGSEVTVVGKGSNFQFWTVDCLDNPSDCLKILKDAADGAGKEPTRPPSADDGCGNIPIVADDDKIIIGTAPQDPGQGGGNPGADGNKPGDKPGGTTPGTRPGGNNPTHTHPGGARPGQRPGSTVTPAQVQMLIKNRLRGHKLIPRKDSRLKSILAKISKRK